MKQDQAWQSTELRELQKNLKNQDLDPLSKLGGAPGEDVKVAAERAQAILDRAKKAGMPERAYDNWSGTVRDIAQQAGFHAHIDETFDTNMHQPSTEATSEKASSTGPSGGLDNAQVLRAIGDYNGSMATVFPEDAKVKLGLAESATAEDVARRGKDLREFLTTDPTMTGLSPGEHLNIESNLEQFLSKALEDDFSFKQGPQNDRDAHQDPQDVDQTAAPDPGAQQHVDPSQSPDPAQASPQSSSSTPTSIFKTMMSGLGAHAIGVLRGLGNAAKKLAVIALKGAGLAVAYQVGAVSVGTWLAPHAAMFFGSAALVAATPVAVGALTAMVAMGLWRKFTN